MKSHPVWVRGLKLKRQLVTTGKLRSHPVWVRGLKPVTRNSHDGSRRVAPRVGAWIETAGFFAFTTSIALSHPVWVRGLKLDEEWLEELLEVAPRVGAWIETIYTSAIYAGEASHPVWVRGLKPLITME